MRLATCGCVALVGVQGHLVQVEVHIGGMPGFVLVGLPDTALAEARDRVRAAVLCSGEPWPQQRITVNLSPASIPKRGTHFDLPVAVAVLAADGRLPDRVIDGLVLLGELGLDGAVRPVRGVLPAVLAAHDAGVRRVVVPAANAGEARLVPDMQVLGATSLAQVVALLRGELLTGCASTGAVDDRAAGVGAPPRPDVAAGCRAATPAGCPPTGDDRAAPDLADVIGQGNARRAVEVAAAGHHHLLLTGPPGGGKTMLARRLPGLLPDLRRHEALEVTAIHSLAGILPEDRPLVTRPPFADPHHSASRAAIVGGGSRLVRPGAAACAHRGVLLLDEAPEFGPHVLDCLRQPLEHGEIVVDRAEFSARFPARFLLVLASNPCPCGHHGGSATVCECTPDAVRRYTRRLSGPVRDRVDLTVWVKAPSLVEMRAGTARSESSRAVAVRVAEARERQARRLAGTPWSVNGDVPGPTMRRHFAPQPGSMEPVERFLATGALSARGADRVLRVAWTLADLAGRDRPGRREVLEAHGLRAGLAA